MNSTWGVYPVTTNQGGAAAAAADGSAGKPTPPKRWLVRWRVDGVMRKRSFVQKGHAETFRDQLIVAKVKGWEADGRGWPVDPDRRPPTRDPDSWAVGVTFEEYANAWYDIRRSGFGDKNRRGHRDNMRFAVGALRYGPETRGFDSAAARSPVVRSCMDDLVADDVLRAISVRFTTNARTAASNQRRIREAFEQGLPAVGLMPERASGQRSAGSTSRLAMIINAARESNVDHPRPARWVRRGRHPSRSRGH